MLFVIKEIVLEYQASLPSIYFFVSLLITQIFALSLKLLLFNQFAIPP